MAIREGERARYIREFQNARIFKDPWFCQPIAPLDNLPEDLRPIFPNVKRVILEGPNGIGKSSISGGVLRLYHALGIALGGLNSGEKAPCLVGYAEPPPIPLIPGLPGTTYRGMAKSGFDPEGITNGRNAQVAEGDPAVQFYYFMQGRRLMQEEWLQQLVGPGDPYARNNRLFNYASWYTRALSKWPLDAYQWQNGLSGVEKAIAVSDREIISTIYYQGRGVRWGGRLIDETQRIYSTGYLLPSDLALMIVPHKPDDFRVNPERDPGDLYSRHDYKMREAVGGYIWAARKAIEMGAVRDVIYLENDPSGHRHDVSESSFAAAWLIYVLERIGKIERDTVYSLPCNLYVLINLLHRSIYGIPYSRNLGRFFARVAEWDINSACWSKTLQFGQLEFLGMKDTNLSFRVNSSMDFLEN